jgi:small subunit ribosomal protein S6
MKNYEVTFIVDPVLSGDEIETTAQTYVNYLEKVGCHIVHVDKMGLRTLAYEIKRRSSGVYFCIEFQSPNGEFMDDFELALRRDERLLRFLTIALDKFGVKYNDDKRHGLIGKKKRPGAETREEAPATPAPAAVAAPAPAVPAPAVVEAPVEVAAPAVVEAPVEAAAPAVVEAAEEVAAAAPAVVEEEVVETVTEPAAEVVEEVAEAAAESEEPA